MIRNTNEVTTIADLRTAMTLHRPVTIDYESAQGIRSVRKVEIFEIVDREAAEKRPFFRAMDRQSGDYRSFRFDRVAAYRVANARGRYRVPRPGSEDSMEFSSAPTTAATPEITTEVVDLDAEWGAWLENQYDPDAPIPFLPTLYALTNEEK